MKSCWAVLVLAALLSGCQSLPRAVPAIGDGTPADEAFAARHAALTAVDEWTLRGRGALNAQGRGWSGALHWQQSGEALDLRFIAPLGAGTLRLTGHPDALRIQTSDGTDFLSIDPAGDLERALGFALPLEALRWWVLGLPPPAAPLEALELDEAGRAIAFAHDGWRVSFPRYARHGGTVVPGVIVAERDDARIRVVVEDWHP